jgi:hypothetical protein
MTSHTDYIQDQTEEQLEHLIQVATHRLQVLQQGGWTNLWVVADYCNKGWFAYDQYTQAADFMGLLVQAHARDGKSFEVSLEKGRCRPSDAAGLFADTKMEVARLAKLLA